MVAATASSLVTNAQNLGGIVMDSEGLRGSQVEKWVLGLEPGRSRVQSLVLPLMCVGLGRAGHFPYFGLSFLPLNKN